MSELIQKHDDHATIRWKLLTGVSAMALTAYVSSASLLRAEDASQPQIWIELGGQLSRLNDGQEAFSPVFPTSTPARPSIFSPSQKFEYPPRFSIDEDGKVSFEPGNSDWIFSASIRYGRASANKHAHQQTNPKTWVGYAIASGRRGKVTAKPVAGQFADTLVQNSEKHFVLDFQAGKDVGLGMFGGENGTSVLSLGVRFAQFLNKSNIALKSDPDFHFKYVTNPIFKSFGFTTSKLPVGEAYHSNSANLRAERKFHGVGPSLSWNASAPFAGNSDNGQLLFDWELNAALLFGRQRTKVHHQTTGRYHNWKYGPAVRPITFQYPATPDRTRVRDVTVPNVGGSLGLSYRMENFKMSFGYRADFFFNAIDGGIDARKNENRAFFGPYASISIGIGD